jgi:hypothetical protein
MTVDDLLARTTSRELTEWQLWWELRHDEDLYFHEHPRTTYDDYLEAREQRDEHARKIGRADRPDDDDDSDEEEGDFA